jgi:hypothetical protein
MLGRKPSHNATSRGRGQEHEEAEAELSYGNSHPKAKSLFVQATTWYHTLRDFSLHPPPPLLASGIVLVIRDRAYMCSIVLLEVAVVC